MILDRWVRSLEQSLWRVGRRFWPEDRVLRQRERIDVASERLQRQSALLDRWKEEVDDLRRNLNAGEMKAALLASRVEEALRNGNQKDAWSLAMELEALRARLRDDRAWVEHVESGYREKRERFEERTLRLAELQETVSEPQTARPRRRPLRPA